MCTSLKKETDNEMQAILRWILKILRYPSALYVGITGTI